MPHDDGVPPRVARVKRGRPLRRYKRIDNRRALNRATVQARRSKPRPGLAQARRFVEGRADGKCEARCAPNCQRRGTQAHHMLMRSQGGTDDPDNLLWVCAPCHDQIHMHPAESYERGWLRRRAG